MFKNVNVWYMASGAQYGHVVRRQVPFVRSSGAGMRAALDRMLYRPLKIHAGGPKRF